MFRFDIDVPLEKELDPYNQVSTYTVVASVTDRYALDFYSFLCMDNNLSVKYTYLPIDYEEV